MDVLGRTLLLFQDYSDAQSVLVRGQATLKLQTDKATINMESHSTKVPVHLLLVPPGGHGVHHSVCSVQIEVHIYPDVGQQLYSSAPLWIIVVSVLAGVVLLILICLLLWKVK